jgi:hypothetical protein
MLRWLRSGSARHSPGTVEGGEIRGSRKHRQNPDYQGVRVARGHAVVTLAAGQAVRGFATGQPAVSVFLSVVGQGFASPVRALQVVRGASVGARFWRWWRCGRFPRRARPLPCPAGCRCRAVLGAVAPAGVGAGSGWAVSRFPSGAVPVPGRGGFGWRWASSWSSSASLAPGRCGFCGPGLGSAGGWGRFCPGGLPVPGVGALSSVPGGRFSAGGLLAPGGGGSGPAPGAVVAFPVVAGLRAVAVFAGRVSVRQGVGAVLSGRSAGPGPRWPVRSPGGRWSLLALVRVPGVGGSGRVPRGGPCWRWCRFLAPVCCWFVILVLFFYQKC